MSVPLKAAAATASLALALLTAPATAFADPQFHMKEQARLSAQEVRGVRLGALTLRQHRLLAREYVRHRRAEMIASWKARASRAVHYAFRQRGRPYRYGGTGRGGFDCSGLVQQSWRHAGVRLARMASAQFHTIRKHVPPRRLRPGDLVFFNGLGHVGMYIGHHRFIHSPHTGDHVRVARLAGYYRSAFVGATRPAWRPLPRIPEI